METGDASQSVVLTAGGLFRFGEFVNNATVLVHRSTAAILTPPACQVPKDELLVRREQERLTRPLGLLMRADGLDELKRLLGVEMQPAFVGVFDVVEVTPDRQLDVAARDDLDDLEHAHDDVTNL